MARASARVNAIAALCALGAALASSCDRTALGGLGDPDAGSDAGSDAGTDAGADAGADAGTDAGTDAGADAGFQTARAILHLHSPLSHDACDGASESGVTLATADQNCLRQLKAALCRDRIDVAFLTDHPRFMDRQPFADDLLFQSDGGEELLGDAGAPETNRLTCPDGHTVLLAVGFEGTHTMPLALRRHLPDDLYGIHVDFNTSLADDQRLLASIQAAGGVFFTAHTEQADLPASRLVELATDGTEWFNMHGVFMQIFDGDVIGGGSSLSGIGRLLDSLAGIEPFLLGATGGAHPDLVALELLRDFPEAGLAKWHEVLGQRKLSAGIGSDVHQNVKVSSICNGAAAQAACALAGPALPNLVNAFVRGGPLLLSDGERVDSYARVMRWFNKRLLVREKTLDAYTDAIARGRNLGVCAVLGEPGAVSLSVETPQGRLDLGDRGLAAGATLHVRLPDAPAPDLGATWTTADAQNAEVRGLLIRDTPGHSDVLLDFSGIGAERTLAAPGPGAYSLEVRIRPRHLNGALGPSTSLAGKEYRWVLTNAIVLE